MIPFELVEALLSWLLLLIYSKHDLENKLFKKLMFYTQSLKRLVNVLKEDTFVLRYIQNLKNGINQLSQGHNMLILELQACSLRVKTESEQKLFFLIKECRFPVYSIVHEFFIPDNLFVENETRAVPNTDICDSKEPDSKEPDSKESNLAYFMGLYPKYGVTTHSEYFQWFNEKINKSSLETKICTDENQFGVSCKQPHHYGYLKAYVYNDGNIVNKALLTLELDVDGKKERISSDSPELYGLLTFSEKSYFEKKIREIIKKLMRTAGVWKKCFRENCYFHKKPFLQKNSDSKIRCPHMHTQCENCGKEEHLDSCEVFGKFNQFIENIFDDGFSETVQDRKEFYPWLF